MRVPTNKVRCHIQPTVLFCAIGYGTVQCNGMNTITVTENVTVMKCNNHFNFGVSGLEISKKKFFDHFDILFVSKNTVVLVLSVQRDDMRYSSKGPLKVAPFWYGKGHTILFLNNLCVP